MNPVRTPVEWFQEAARCYIEQHQGCAWCGGSHRVFQILRQAQIVYYCHTCDFRAEFDQLSGDYLLVPGEKQVHRCDTMLDFAI